MPAVVCSAHPDKPVRPGRLCPACHRERERYLTHRREHRRRNRDGIEPEHNPTDRRTQ